jgi:hypothetical protein
MNDRDLELTGLVLARELLRKRGTDISELEREIDRITQPDAAARPSRPAVNGRAVARPSIGRSRIEAATWR